MKKKMRGVGLLVLMLSCGVVSLAEETPPTPTNPICFGTGLINGDQGIEITGYNTSNPACGKNVVIPDKIDGKPVTSIGDSAFYNNQLTSVVIPGSVTSIGDNAFYVNELTSVVIPGSVKTIGAGAFTDNPLNSLEIQDWVESIGAFAFFSPSRTSNLTSVVIPSSIKNLGYYTFNSYSLTKVEILSWVKALGEAAFAENQLSSVVIPGSVMSITGSAFANNQLTTVEILSWVKVIEYNAFAGNPLTSIVIPDSLTKIEWGAFDKSGKEYTYTGVTIGILSKEKEFGSIDVEEDAHIKLVKFDLAEGTGTISIACKGTGCSVTSDPTRAGYVFSGWSERLKVWDEGSSNWNTGHQTIIAQWNSDPSSSSSSSSSSWGGYSWGGGGWYSSTSNPSNSSTPSTEQKKPETPVKNEPVKTEQVKTEIFNPTIQTTCFNPLDKQTIDQGNKMSELLRIAHQMLYSYSLTKWQGTKDFAPERSLTREEAARFMTEFATNVLCRKASRTYNDHFTDLEKVNPELLPYIKKSYEYLIFNGDSNAEGKKEKTTFRPKELITVGELSAIMTRLVRNELLEEVEWDRSKNYRTYINAITPKSDLKNEVRGTVAEVIYDLYRNNSYELKDIGYVIKK